MFTLPIVTVSTVNASISCVMPPPAAELAILRVSIPETPAAFATVTAAVVTKVSVPSPPTTVSPLVIAPIVMESSPEPPVTVRLLPAEAETSRVRAPLKPEASTVVMAVEPVPVSVRAAGPDTLTVARTSVPLVSSSTIVEALPAVVIEAVSIFAISTSVDEVLVVMTCVLEPVVAAVA